MSTDDHLLACSWWFLYPFAVKKERDLDVEEEAQSETNM
jgi:hypothetical protein